MHRARAMGHVVNMLTFGEDIAFPDLARPRRLAGTLLVNRGEGAVAGAGTSLHEVTTAARKIAEGARSDGWGHIQHTQGPVS